MIDLRGSVLGKLTTGSLRVTDTTPNDRYAALVVGRKVTQERMGPRTVVYRGQGLRFRMLGGGYRMVARGSGITVSAVGHGFVTLDGDPRYAGDDVGVYSLEGVDCSAEPLSCAAAPDGARHGSRSRRRRRSGRSGASCREHAVDHPRRRGRDLDRLVRRGVPPERGLRSEDGSVGAGGAPPARRRIARAGDPRPQSPGRRRRRAVPPDPQDLGRPDPDAHRARRGHRQDHRSRGRRGRLHDEAVQSA